MLIPTVDILLLPSQGTNKLGNDMQSISDLHTFFDLASHFILKDIDSLAHISRFMTVNKL